MSKHKHLVQNVVFFAVLGLAVTAEGWMDLLCRVIF